MRDVPFDQGTKSARTHDLRNRECSGGAFCPPSRAATITCSAFALPCGRGGSSSPSNKSPHISSISSSKIAAKHAAVVHDVHRASPEAQDSLRIWRQHHLAFAQCTTIHNSATRASYLTPTAVALPVNPHQTSPKAHSNRSLFNPTGGDAPPVGLNSDLNQIRLLQ
jgi:hypothetical protein